LYAGAQSQQGRWLNDGAQLGRCQHRDRSLDRRSDRVGFSRATRRSRRCCAEQARAPRRRSRHGDPCLPNNPACTSVLDGRHRRSCRGTGSRDYRADPAAISPLHAPRFSLTAWLSRSLGIRLRSGHRLRACYATSPGKAEAGPTYPLRASGRPGGGESCEETRLDRGAGRLRWTPARTSVALWVKKLSASHYGLEHDTGTEIDKPDPALVLVSVRAEATQDHDLSASGRACVGALLEALSDRNAADLVHPKS
jgi:hypothetical protein